MRCLAATDVLGAPPMLYMLFVKTDVPCLCLNLCARLSLPLGLLRTSAAWPAPVKFFGVWQGPWCRLFWPD